MQKEFKVNDAGYLLTDIAYDDFIELYRNQFTHYFRPRINFYPEDFQCKLPAFSCFQLLHHDKVIGLFSVYEDVFSSVKMHLSVVHPDYRKKGLYYFYLDSLIEHYQKRGIKQIISEHSNSNNPIIIAKLRKNFYITNVQVSPFFGAEVQLARFLDPDMENIFKFRCGDITLTKSMNKQFSEQIDLYSQFFAEIQE